MRRGFTLIELIFVIVIMGILAAVAIPKFKHLKENSEVANVISAISDINGSGGASSYFNATELNGVKKADLNLSAIYKFQGARWSLTNNDDTATYTSTDGDLEAEFDYGNDGDVNVTLTCHTQVYTDIFSNRGYTCSSNGDLSTIHLSSQE